VLAKEDDNARLDNIVVVYYILVVVVVRESYSKNPSMRTFEYSENEKKQTCRKRSKKKQQKQNFVCLFSF
jgi:hypothetical protein